MTSKTRRLIREELTGAIPLRPVSMPTPRATADPRQFVLPIIGVTIVSLVVVWFIAYRLGSDNATTPAPTVATPVSTLATRPTPIAYPTILAAFPNSAIQHGYTLMCKGKVWEFATEAEVWALQRDARDANGKPYAAADCKCFLPRYEGQGYRECATKSIKEK